MATIVTLRKPTVWFRVPDASYNRRDYFHNQQ